jgi:hypothetical protein
VITYSYPDNICVTIEASLAFWDMTSSLLKALKNDGIHVGKKKPRICTMTQGTTKLSPEPPGCIGRSWLDKSIDTMGIMDVERTEIKTIAVFDTFHGLSSHHR